MKLTNNENNNEQKKLSIKDIAIIVLSVLFLILLLLIVYMSRKQDKMIADTLEKNSEMSMDDALANVNSSALDYLEITEVSGEKWIEIHNSGDAAVDLSGLKVKVSGKTEATLEDGAHVGKDGYFVVDLTTNPGNADENVITICNAEDKVIKSFLVPKLDSDKSYGLADSEQNVWGYMIPTKGKDNEKEDLQYLKMGGVSVSAPGGFYNSSFRIELSSDRGEKIYYTTDGSKPTTKSQLYEEPIAVINKSGSNYVYAREAMYNRLYTNYMPGSVDAGMIIRAITVDASGNTTGEMSQGYYIGLGKDSDYLNLPVVSIITDPENLFDYAQGIYIAGKQREDARIQGLKPEYYANYYNPWKKPAKIEYYEPTKDKTFEMEANININNDRDIASRQKGFVISVDNSSYSKFNGSSIIDFISSDGNIRLTTNFEDNDIKVRNLLADSLIEDTDIAVTGCKPCVLFIDGEYWGLYTFRPYPDANYIKNRYGIQNEEIITHSGKNYNQTYASFYDFVTQTDLSLDANYEQVKTMMDVDNYIDYICLNIYLANSSFSPQSDTAWRTVKTGGSGMADGRWRFITGDLSNTMYLTENQTPTINSYLQLGVQGDLMFQSLLMNKDFCKSLESRMSKLVSSNLNLEKCDENLDEIINLTKKPALASYSRFDGNLSETAYSLWTENIRVFFEGRGDYIIAYTQELAQKGGDPAKAREIINENADDESEEELTEELLDEEGNVEEGTEESDTQNGINNDDESENTEDNANG